MFKKTFLPQDLEVFRKCGLVGVAADSRVKGKDGKIYALVAIMACDGVVIVDGEAVNVEAKDAVVRSQYGGFYELHSSASFV